MKIEVHVHTATLTHHGIRETMNLEDLLAIRQEVDNAIIKLVRHQSHLQKQAGRLAAIKKQVEEMKDAKNNPGD